MGFNHSLIQLVINQRPLATSTNDLSLVNIDFAGRGPTAVPLCLLPHRMRPVTTGKRPRKYHLI